MSFHGLYWLLLLVPAIAAILLSRFMIYDRHASMRFSLPLKMRPEANVRAELASFVPYMFRGLAILLLCLAMARPQLVQKKVLPPDAGVDIMLCIDTSSSMQANDFPPNRIEAAKQAALDFIEKRKTDRIGIVVFAVNAMLQCPLTNDYASLEEFLNQVRIGMTYTDGTAIGDAIATSANHLKNSAAKTKIIVLLTDGRSNSGIITDPVLAAKAAASYGIKIYTIGTASEEATRGIRGQDDTLDRPTLTEIARVTGGEFFHARSRAELEKIYSIIDKQEKTEFKNQVSVTYFDKYMYFLLPALALLFAEFVLVRTVFLRIP